MASLPWCRSLFLMRIPLNSPKRDGQDFFLKRRSSLTCISSGILFVLGFLFSLRFYDDSGVCSKYFQSRVSAVPWAYPLSAHGLGSVRPNLMKVRHAIFLLLQLPPSPYGFVTPEWTDQWGDGSIFWGLTDLKEDDANDTHP